MCLRRLNGRWLFGLGGCLSLLLGRRGVLDVHIYVDLIFFFIRLDFLRVIHVDRQIERLVLNSFAPHVILLGHGSWRGFFRRGCFRRSNRDVFLSLVGVKVFADIQSLALLVESIVVAIHF